MGPARDRIATCDPTEPVLSDYAEPIAHHPVASYGSRCSPTPQTTGSRRQTRCLTAPYGWHEICSQPVRLPPVLSTV